MRSECCFIVLLFSFYILCLRALFFGIKTMMMMINYNIHLSKIACPSSEAKRNWKINL